MNVRNPWVKQAIAHVHVFEQGKLILQFTIPAKKVIVTGKNIEIHYAQKSGFQIFSMSATQAYSMNITITEKNGNLLEVWALPIVNWSGGSQANTSGFYCFSSPHARTIKSKYTG